MKNQKGITLIALIITIIVMLILVAVSVTIALESGLFNAAQSAAKNTNQEATNEMGLSDGKVFVDGKEYTSMQQYVDILKGGAGNSGTGDETTDPEEGDGSGTESGGETTEPGTGEEGGTDTNTPADGTITFTMADGLVVEEYTVEEGTKWSEFVEDQLITSPVFESNCASGEHSYSYYWTFNSYGRLTRRKVCECGDLDQFADYVYTGEVGGEGDSTGAVTVRT